MVSNSNLGPAWSKAHISPGSMGSSGCVSLSEDRQPLLQPEKIKKSYYVMTSSGPTDDGMSLLRTYNHTLQDFFHGHPEPEFENDESDYRKKRDLGLGDEVIIDASSPITDLQADRLFDNIGFSQTGRNSDLESDPVRMNFSAGAHYANNELKLRACHVDPGIIDTAYGGIYVTFYDPKLSLSTKLNVISLLAGHLKLASTPVPPKTKFFILPKQPVRTQDVEKQLEITGWTRDWSFSKSYSHPSHAPMVSTHLQSRPMKFKRELKDVPVLEKMEVTVLKSSRLPNQDDVCKYQHDLAEMLEKLASAKYS